MPMDIQKKSELLSVLESAFHAIIRVSPEEDACWFLKGVHARHDGRRFSYSRLLQSLDRFIYAKYRKAVLNGLNPDTLKKRDFRLDHALNFAYATFGEEKWVSLSFVSDPQSRYVYLLLSQCSEYDVVLKDIVSLYVYDRCDYFIYLDAHTNSYVMFGAGNSGTPLPPQVCLDYDTEIVKYADSYVPPEDRERVIREMKLARVTEMLELRGTHSFYTGIMDPLRGYTRKKLEYQYYDRDRKKILLWRTDITELYRDEMERNARLREALLRAQTDSMTGLLNKQTFEDKVREVLQDSDAPAAFLFVDLDNFKGVNDSYGHSTGDRVLLTLTTLLQRETQHRQALVGRLGGDEFAVFLRRLRAPDEAEQLARAVCADFAAQSDQFGFLVSCSIGIANFPNDAADYEALAEKADHRAYRVKSSGKNGFLARG